MVLSSRISTRTRVALWLALVFVVFVGLNMAALGGLVFPAFASFERDDAIRNIGRVAHAIRREQAFMADFSADWAHWDDTYAFVEHFDPEYFDGNLTAAATAATPTDLIAIHALDGTPRHLDVYHALADARPTVRALMAPGGAWHAQLVQPLLARGATAGADDSIDAVLSLDGQPVLASAHAVLDSERRRPSRGVLVMARLFDIGQLASLQQQTLVPFTMTHHATAVALPGGDRFATRDGDRGWIAVGDGNRLLLRVQIAAADGGVFEVGTDYAREMTRQGGVALLWALGISTLGFVLLVGGLYHRLLARSFLQPLRSIVGELRRIEDDRDLSARLPVQGAAELQRLALSFNAMMVELEAQRDEIALLSMTDPLTRLPNRRQFEQVLAREWQRAQRQGESLAVLLADIDYFKTYNDHYGHLPGDDCLRRVAQALQRSLKRRTDFAARYGGEEFVLVLPDTDAHGALTAARRILEVVRRLRLPHARSPVAGHVTISIGTFAARPDADSRVDDWIARADAALYQAKADGRDRVVQAAAGLSETR